MDRMIDPQPEVKFLEIRSALCFAILVLTAASKPFLTIALLEIVVNRIFAALLCEGCLYLVGESKTLGESGLHKVGKLDCGLLGCRQESLFGEVIQAKRAPAE